MVNAYVFAQKATADAVAALKARVADTGPVRVVLPLVGAYALYVALYAETVAEVTAITARVRDTAGLAGTVAYVATQPVVEKVAERLVKDDPDRFPTWGVVERVTAFGVLTTAAPTDAAAAYQAAAGQPGVIGIATLSGPESVLVEVTAGTVEEAAQLLDGVTAAAAYAVTLAGSVQAFGDSAYGAGLNTAY